MHRIYETAQDLNQDAACLASVPARASASSGHGRDGPSIFETAPEMLEMPASGTLPADAHVAESFKLLDTDSDVSEPDSLDFFQSIVGTNSNVQELLSSKADLPGPESSEAEKRKKHQRQVFASIAARDSNIDTASEPHAPPSTCRTSRLSTAGSKELTDARQQELLKACSEFQTAIQSAPDMHGPGSKPIPGDQFFEGASRQPRVPDADARQPEARPELPGPQRHRLVPIERHGSADRPPATPLSLIRTCNDHHSNRSQLAPHQQRMQSIGPPGKTAQGSATAGAGMQQAGVVQKAPVQPQTACETPLASDSPFSTRSSKSKPSVHWASTTRPGRLGSSSSSSLSSSKASLHTQSFSLSTGEHDKLMQQAGQVDQPSQTGPRNAEPKQPPSNARQWFPALGSDSSSLSPGNTWGSAHSTSSSLSSKRSGSPAKAPDDQANNRMHPRMINSPGRSVSVTLPDDSFTGPADISRRPSFSGSPDLDPLQQKEVLQKAKSTPLLLPVPDFPRPTSGKIMSHSTFEGNVTYATRPDLARISVRGRRTRRKSLVLRFLCGLT